ncbi:MAG: cold shock domain-containing protein, partial [Cyanothece sp. SIO1E1]|nr:cold shock domain-containing protein [Cyanothece sp. SIO1E1]
SLQNDLVGRNRHLSSPNKKSWRDPLVDGLFVQGESKTSAPEKKSASPPAEVKVSTVHSLKNGYGFISFPPNNLFFHYTSLLDGDFNELQVGDEVEFTIGLNDEGQQVAKTVRLLWWDEEE